MREHFEQSYETPVREKVVFFLSLYAKIASKRKKKIKIRIEREHSFLPEKRFKHRAKVPFSSYVVSCSS